MAHTKHGETTTIQLIVPVEAKKALETMAEREAIASVSALVRQLLTNYCQYNGLDVSFNVGQWGGKRESAALRSQQASKGQVPVAAHIADGKIYVTLADGRVIAHPVAWYPWLVNATPTQQANIQLEPSAIIWPDLDEGLSIDGMLKGPLPGKKNTA